MMATRERRRNQYAGNCKVCGVTVESGAGWLYSDTHSNHARSRRRSNGRWPKFVKCDRCHSGNYGSKADLPENRPAPLEKVGIDQIRRGVFRPGYYLFGPWKRRETCVELVLPDGAAEVVALLRPIEWTPMACGEYGEGVPCFGGRVLTHAAAVEVERLGVIAADLFETYLYDPRETE